MEDSSSPLACLARIGTCLFAYGYDSCFVVEQMSVVFESRVQLIVPLRLMGKVVFDPLPLLLLLAEPVSMSRIQLLLIWCVIVCFRTLKCFNLTLPLGRLCHWGICKNLCCGTRTREKGTWIMEESKWIMPGNTSQTEGKLSDTTYWWRWRSWYVACGIL